MNLKNPKPKYVKIDSNNPSALGICDDTDFVFNKEDLVPQMEWRGDKLVPTGFLRGKPFIDEPNEQLRTPLLKADPYPVKNPRLPQPSSPGYYPEGFPAPPNEDIKAVLEQVVFTYYTAPEQPNPVNPNPETNPTAPKGAPDGIEVPKKDAILAQLKQVTFNQ